MITELQTSFFTDLMHDDVTAFTTAFTEETEVLRSYQLTAKQKEIRDIYMFVVDFKK